jgi:uncharacterized protein (TIGR00369 family)
MSDLEIPRPEGFTRCYGCGADNARGLGLVFQRTGDEVVASFTPAREHGGYGRMVHGGVITTLLDEAFGWALYGLLGKVGITTELSAAFHAPLRCGEALRVRGWVERHDARFAVLRAEVHDARGQLAASGTGTMRLVSMRAIQRLGGLETEG